MALWSHSSKGVVRSSRINLNNVSSPGSLNAGRGTKLLWVLERARGKSGQRGRGGWESRPWTGRVELGPRSLDMNLNDSAQLLSSVFFRSQCSSYIRSMPITRLLLELQLRMINIALMRRCYGPFAFPQCSSSLRSKTDSDLPHPCASCTCRDNWLFPHKSQTALLVLMLQTAKRSSYRTELVPTRLERLQHKAARAAADAQSLLVEANQRVHFQLACFVGGRRLLSSSECFLHPSSARSPDLTFRS